MNKCAECESKAFKFLREQTEHIKEIERLFYQARYYKKKCKKLELYLIENNLNPKDAVAASLEGDVYEQQGDAHNSNSGKV